MLFVVGGFGPISQSKVIAKPGVLVLIPVTKGPWPHLHNLTVNWFNGQGEHKLVTYRDRWMGKEVF